MAAVKAIQPGTTSAAGCDLVPSRGHAPSRDRKGAVPPAALAWLAAVIAVVCLLAPAQAQMVPQPPNSLDPERGLDEQMLEAGRLQERPGEQVPGDLSFTNAAGETVELAELFDNDRPVVLNLGYFECPALCGQMTQGLADALGELAADGRVAGDQFELVTLSFNHEEQFAQAASAKRSMAGRIGEDAVDDWHFLVGDEEAVTAVTRAVGFGFKWSEREKQYLHEAAIMVLMPDGRVSRYLYGVDYEPRTLWLSLVEASDGKIGTTGDRIVLYCYAFDPLAGQYTMAVLNMVRIAAVLTVVGLATAIITLSVRTARRRRELGIDQA